MKEIKSHTNEYVKMLASLKRKKDRDKQQKYLIEGSKTIEEAVGYRAPVESILLSDKNSALVARAKREGIKLIHVPYDIIQQIADTKSPPKEIACVRIEQNLPDYGGKFYMALDDVRDPKNLGTIIRTADAAGVDGIFISENSADMFGPKAQRAAMGSTFHVPIEICPLKQTFKNLRDLSVKIISGCTRGEETLPDRVDKVCVVVGNEARGISEDTRKLSDYLYRIRIYGHAESLNASVAAGIMLYEIRNRLITA